MLPAITELAQDHKWRVRLAIIEYIPKLAKQLGESFFNEELLSLCMSWLWDPVYAIREAAVNNLKELTVIFGSEWAQVEIINRLLNQGDKIDNDDGNGDNDNNDKVDYSNFIIRITCLFAITSLIPVIDYKVLIDKVLPFINGLINDSVPNIRFNVAKSYLILVESLSNKKKSGQLSETNDQELKKFIDSQVLSNLQKLENDDDVDVRFYSIKSIKGINEILA